MTSLTTWISRSREALAGLLAVACCAFIDVGHAVAQDCAGDCDSDRAVAINEVIFCVTIALGTRLESDCPACDANGDGMVAIAELVQTVRIVLGQASLLESTGSCFVPGAAGLESCAEGTPIRITRCDDFSDCLTLGAGTPVAAGTIGPGGEFELTLDVCQVVRATLVVTAEVAPVTSYRAIDLGPVGTGAAAVGSRFASTLRGIVISPISEAAVRLLAEPGADACSADAIQAVQIAVDSANVSTNFTDLDPAMAVDTAVGAALGDSSVQASLACIDPDTEMNLLQNPGAEDGPASKEDVVAIPGWTTTSNFTVAAYDETDLATFSESIGGGMNLFAGGPRNALSTAFQTVDVTPHATAIDAGGARLALSAYMGGYRGQGDSGTVAAVFLDVSGEPLGQVTIGPVSADDRADESTLLLRSLSTAIPVATRAIRVVITATRSSGSYNDGYIDNVFLGIGPAAGSTTSEDVRESRSRNSEIL